jgi:energy-converting hydrogenase Eha subunit C
MSMFWFTTRDSVTLLLVVWTAAIAVFVDSDLVDRFLWIPVSLGLTGVLGAIFVLAIPANVILAANVATLVLFITSFEVLKKKRRSSLTVDKASRLMNP